MASGAVIGALRVVLGADTVSLEKGLKDAQSGIERFASSAKLGIAAAAAVVTGAMAAMAVSVRSAINNADEMGKAAQRLGLSTEELSKLKYAADLADVSFEQLSKSVVKMDKAMSSAAAGGENDFTRALDAMGISLFDSNKQLKSQTQIIDEIADKFQGYADGANKTALAVAVFQKGGQNLIPLLNQGSEGLRQAREEAEKFGLVIKTSTSIAAQDLNDNLKRLEAMQRGFANTLANEVTPSLAKLSEVIVRTAQESQGYSFIAGTLSNAIKGLGAAAVAASAGFSILMGTVKTAFTVIVEGAKGNLTAAGEAIIKWRQETTQTVAKAMQDLNAIFAGFKPPTFSLADIQKAIRGITEAPNVKNMDDAKNALQSFLDTAAKAAATRTVEAQAANMSIAALEQLRIKTQAETIAKQEGITINDAYAAAIRKVGDAAAYAAIQQEAARIKEETQTPLEKFNRELERNAELYNRGGLNAVQFARANELTAKRYSVAWDTAAASATGSFSEIANSFASENKKMAQVAQIFAAVSALISTMEAQAKALTLPFPANFVAMAAIAAKGFALVAAIRATTIPNAALGGSFMVPGGISTTDNQLVPMNLAAGERVDVTPANEATAASSTINVDMSGGESFYSRANVERLLNAMHTVLADGHRVQLVILK